MSKPERGERDSEREGEGNNVRKTGRAGKRESGGGARDKGRKLKQERKIGSGERGSERERE